MRLMIVDDHAPAREMIRRILELPGVVFCECTSGEEALQQVREFKPHWITMDVNMPGLAREVGRAVADVVHHKLPLIGPGAIEVA